MYEDRMRLVYLALRPMVIFRPLVPRTWTGGFLSRSKATVNLDLLMSNTNDDALQICT